MRAPWGTAEGPTGQAGVHLGRMLGDLVRLLPSCFRGLGITGAAVCRTYAYDDDEGVVYTGNGRCSVRIRR